MWFGILLLSLRDRYCCLPFWIFASLYSSTRICSLSSTLAKLLESLTSPNISIGIGLSVQATITETVLVLCTVVFTTWSPRSISCNVISLLLWASIFLIKEDDEEEELAARIDQRWLNVKLKRMSWIAGLSIGISRRHWRKLFCFEERWRAPAQLPVLNLLASE